MSWVCCWEEEGDDEDEGSEIMFESASNATVVVCPFATWRVAIPAPICVRGRWEGERENDERDERNSVLATVCARRR